MTRWIRLLALAAITLVLLAAAYLAGFDDGLAAQPVNSPWLAPAVVS